MRVAILLAAGASTRFGPANKLFAASGGRSLLARAMWVASGAPVQRLIVVTGSQSARVAAAVRRMNRQAVIIRTPDFAEGMGASLRAASRRLRPIDREAIVFLADMPWPPPGLAMRLVAAATVGDEIVRPICRGRPGHPVLLRGAALRALSRATGDEGLRRGGYRLRTIPADRRCLADVDRPSMLHRVPAALR